MRGLGLAFVAALMLSGCGTDTETPVITSPAVPGSACSITSTTDRTIQATSPELIKQMTISRDGDLQVSYEANINVYYQYGYTAVYRNGNPVGNWNTTALAGYVTMPTEDIPGWLAGDKVQIYGYTENPGYNITVRNFTVSYRDSDAEPIGTIDIE